MPPAFFDIDFRHADYAISLAFFHWPDSHYAIAITPLRQLPFLSY
jgi:hypothetical protein